MRLPRRALRDDDVLIDIAYRARSTNDRRNLVYPYYSIPREARP